MEDMKTINRKYNTGSVAGLIISVGMGFLIYFVLGNINIVSN